MQRILALLFLSTTLVNPVFAEEVADQSTSPNYAVGGGVGFAGLLHVDYQRWVATNTSIELGLTPLLLHNVVALAFTQHINLAPANGSTNHNFLVSGMAVSVINIGGIMTGPGVRIGYEMLTKRFGISLTAGPAIAIGGEFGGQILPDARLTLWRVKR